MTLVAEDRSDLGRWMLQTQLGKQPLNNGDLVIGQSFKNQGWTKFMFFNRFDSWGNDYGKSFDRQQVIDFKTSRRTFMRFTITDRHYYRTGQYYGFLGTCERVSGTSTFIASEVEVVS